MEKPKHQLDAYRYCLDPRSDHRAFEEWFKRLSYAEIQQGKPNPALDTVRETVKNSIPDVKGFYHDIDQDRAIVSFANHSVMPFNYLSDGYRNMVAMLADISYRAIRLNPHLEQDAAKKTKGIVLIDELDMHLHPKWQRRIVQDLQNAFPDMQFIATTHSPFILQSLESGQVIDLNLDQEDEEQANTYAMLADKAGPGPAYSY